MTFIALADLFSLGQAPQPNRAGAASGNAARIGRNGEPKAMVIELELCQHLSRFGVPIMDPTRRSGDERLSIGSKSYAPGRSINPTFRTRYFERVYHPSINRVPYTCLTGVPFQNSFAVGRDCQGLFLSLSFTAQFLRLFVHTPFPGHNLTVPTKR